MLSRIYNILVLILGESKQGGYDGGTMQYQFNCPECREENGGVPDNKYNLEINLGLGKYHCWRCEIKGKISRLIKQYGNKELLAEYYAAVKDIKETYYYTPELFTDDGSFAYEEATLSLPETFTKINIETCRNKKLLNYLKERSIDQELIDYYNIGYTTWDEPSWQMRNRIIVPSYDINGSLNYWVGRDFENKPDTKKTKYKNPDADKYAIVPHEDKIQWDADIVLVEGALDCIYYPNAIALFGKSIRKDCATFQKIYEKSNGRIIICLDNDVKLEEIKRIYNILDVGRLRHRIWYIRLPEDDDTRKDFGEIYHNYGKKGIVEVLKTAKQFSEIDLII